MTKKNLQNFDTIKSRLMQFVDIMNITKVDFFEKISMSPSNFAGIGGRSSLKSDNIVKVLIEFPDLSPDWLLLGRGEMLRSGANAVVQGNSGNVCQGGVQSVVSGAGATVQQPSAQDVESLLAIISQKDIKFQKWINPKEINAL